MGFGMRIPEAACAYPLIAPECATPIATVTPRYRVQQLAYLGVGSLLVLLVTFKLAVLVTKRDRGQATQRNILLLLLCAAVLLTTRAIDPLGLNNVLPYVLVVGMSDACTGCLETAIIVMLMFWIRVMEGDVQEYSPRLLFVGGLSIAAAWVANVVFPILQWYYWDTGDHVIERIKISTALVITLLMTTTVSIYGWKIHRRLEDILDAASLEAPIDDYDYVLSTKNVLGQGASPTLPLPLPPPSVRSYHGACCLRSKMLETLVGLQLVAGFIFILQIYTIFRVETQNDSVVTCVMTGCTHAHMNVPIMPIAQVLGICAGVWIFRHV
ncbi:hypothetical protein SDRG_05968 [Saprolegnia diclina VS20]|uniref:G-protein coupled receptors family 3 profile domain-containing protein n=1 Tax=Saprolegnia diclina (strain VS20) TaxID=1156394 RepID=T0S1I8_SAPDV|nr:hypothetical protein SDRG_05968 [Saprolegnia diclina VS20]EQC36517.1 hypothetical protein SDRG_05968 [Saprolegnia diclina VS20]|eukprot:XP_008609938.1 hypothetical protein SDRG_05968 [Saprolegnia diclina VS20]